MRLSDFNDYSGLNLVGAIRKLHSKDVAIEGFKGTIESKERCIKELEQSIDVHDQAESYLSDLIEQKGRDIAELVDCLKDMEKGDDGHAWTVARRLIEKYGAES